MSSSLRKNVGLFIRDWKDVISSGSSTVNTIWAPTLAALYAATWRCRYFNTRSPKRASPPHFAGALRALPRNTSTLKEPAGTSDAGAGVAAATAAVSACAGVSRGANVALSPPMVAIGLTAAFAALAAPVSAAAPAPAPAPAPAAEPDVTTVRTAEVSDRVTPTCSADTISATAARRGAMESRRTMGEAGTRLAASRSSSPISAVATTMSSSTSSSTSYTAWWSVTAATNVDDTAEKASVVTTVSTAASPPLVVGAGFTWVWRSPTRMWPDDHSGLWSCRFSERERQNRPSTRDRMWSLGPSTPSLLWAPDASARSVWSTRCVPDGSTVPVTVSTMTSVAAVVVASPSPSSSSANMPLAALSRPSSISWAPSHATYFTVPDTAALSSVVMRSVMLHTLLPVST
mmetsp:Transcript_53786/g.109392  ORF Transcript_53786/g.109392 Transcript_53786/m.109392 type:complete len:403 (+) Transcript_53786:560-1768(+)